jgi:rRNA maturation endonuclease Nob1
VAKTVGDLRVLSDADKQILALAFELKEAGEDPAVVTDDYSMQNVAHKLGVKFSALMTLGIRYRFQWIIYCPACHRKFPGDFRDKSCSICGTILKRKPINKVQV